MSKPKVYLSCPLQVEVRELLAETTEVAFWPEWTPVPQDILMKECVDASGLNAAIGTTGTVSAAVNCDVSLADITLPGIPGSRTMSSSAASPVDAYRERG